MESSRIFIRGLPPSLGEDEFRKHFSQRHGITDAKLFPHRRIGYVGYRNSDDAATAVKYFNRTFINMSRIAVELARPAAETSQPRSASVRPPPTASKSEVKVGASVDKDAENPLKRKRMQPVPTTDNPKLAEYLDLMGNKRSGKLAEHMNMGIAQTLQEQADEKIATAPVKASEGASDDEYQKIEKPRKRRAQQEAVAEKSRSTPKEVIPEKTIAEEPQSAEAADVNEPLQGQVQDTEAAPASDADWLRSRTSRLLGLLDDDEELEAQKSKVTRNNANDPEGSDADIPLAEEIEHDEPVDADQPPGPLPADSEDKETTQADANETAIRESKRLFLRNLAYDVREDDLRGHFATFGELEEVHVPMDVRTGKPKGFAYVQYVEADDAVSAYITSDGKTFQGRLLHILPAAVKRDTKLDDFEISKLPLKKQAQIRKKAAAAASTFSWNSLYMNADAVISSVADRLGVSKSDVLDPTSSDAAVRQAVAETHVIQETKSYFLENGVDLEAFKRSTKGDTAILVKNFTYGTKADELRKLFEEHGQLTRFLMPPSGTIAIVEYTQAPQARSAFASLAYRKLKDSVLFLEKAPKELFTRPAEQAATPATATAPVSTADLLQSADSVNGLDATTLFVKNLNFTTSSLRLAETFKPLDGFLSARVKTKTNPKQPQETLSMGFGFLEFRSKAQAQAAIAAMDGFTLDDHQLIIKASQKGMDAAEERRREDRAKKLAAQKSKVIIKNLPFETTKKDVRALLKQYGQLRTVRVPKKFDSTARGFAFAEFTTAKEAANAIEALRNTHLLGRKLVMDYAAEDPEDAEAQIERMQQKVGDQTSKVVLQKLLGAGRQKFNVGGGGADEEVYDE